jgi:hypothetical protein
MISMLAGSPVSNTMGIVSKSTPVGTGVSTNGSHVDGGKIEGTPGATKEKMQSKRSLDMFSTSPALWEAMSLVMYRYCCVLLAFMLVYTT